MILTLSLWCGLAAAGEAANPTPQPVYIHLFSRLDDHVNIHLTDERLQRTLAMLDRYRAQQPRYGASVTFEFNGMVADQLQERNGANHLVDAVKTAARRGLAEAGYDGSDEPTHMSRPMPNFRQAKTAEDRWLARIQPLDWFLSEYKHFLSGEPDPSRPGGLKRALEVFGELGSVGGVVLDLGSDAEAAHLIRRYAAQAVLPGIPESYTWPARNLHGFGGSAVGVATQLSPEAGCAREIFWQDGFLRASTNSGPPVRVVHAYRGPQELKDVLEKLDRSRIHVIQVQLGRNEMYLAKDFNKGVLNPLRYAYENPKFADLPLAANNPRQEIDQAYASEEALVKFLADEFFPANPGSRFILNRELVKMAGSRLNSTVSRRALADAAAFLLDQWQQVTGNHPPDYAQASGQYFSLAEMFLMLANSLAELHQKGSLPESVKLTQVYGPREMPEDQGPPQGEVSVAWVARAAASLAPALADTSWQPLPRNAVPGWIVVDGLRLNAAQFLRLMCQAYAAPSPERRLGVGTSLMFSPLAEVYPRSRPRIDEGAMWTLKPAPLHAAALGQNSR